MIMPTLWLFDIEPHEQRYTGEWRRLLPAQLLKFNIAKKPGTRWKITTVKGGASTGTTTPGAFLNFAETNAYKSKQVSSFSTMVRNRTVQRGDRLLFADAWHPGVIQARYMSDLLDLNLQIFVMFHAGSYDPHDFLGRKVTNKAWSMNFERAVYEAADVSFFATTFHQAMFHKNLDVPMSAKSMIVGWPMEYLSELLASRRRTAKRDVILFPHRLSPEKQPQIAEMVAANLPEYEVVFAQKHLLTKAEYHTLLGVSVAVFSANLQETLGIGVFEGLLCGAVPIVPGRLSYSEMYPEQCYPSTWTETPELAAHHMNDICRFIRHRIHHADPRELELLANTVQSKFFDGSKLYAQVLR